VRITAIQHDICWEDRAASLARLEPVLSSIDADLIVLPEMFAVGFTMSPSVAERDDGPTSAWLVARAADRGAWIGGSIPIVADGAELPSNVFTLVAPSGEIHRYAKRHPFSYADEHRHYAAGNERLVVEVEGVRVAPSICYDLRFVDSYWPLAPETDVFVVVASWPRSRRAHWRALLAARSIENQAYVVGVNRVGSGGGLDYAGDSAVIDPLGEILTTAADVETVLTADIDRTFVDKVRAEMPFMADRRDD